MLAQRGHVSQLLAQMPLGPSSVTCGLYLSQNNAPNDKVARSKQWVLKATPDIRTEFELGERPAKDVGRI